MWDRISKSLNLGHRTKGVTGGSAPTVGNSPVTQLAGRGPGLRADESVPLHNALRLEHTRSLRLTEGGMPGGVTCVRESLLSLFNKSSSALAALSPRLAHKSSHDKRLLFYKKQNKTKKPNNRKSTRLDALHGLFQL